MIPCSSKALANPFEFVADTPCPYMSPTGASSVAGSSGSCAPAVFSTSDIVIGDFQPPRYSGRWSLASDDFTPKKVSTCSMYLDPPRADSSSHSCSLKAVLRSLIVVGSTSIVLRLYMKTSVAPDTCSPAPGMSLRAPPAVSTSSGHEAVSHARVWGL